MKKTLFLVSMLAAGIVAAPVMAANVAKNNDDTVSLNLAGAWTGSVAPGVSDVATWNANSAYGTEASPLNLGGDVSWKGISLVNGKTLFIGYDKTPEGISSQKTLTIGTDGIRTTGGVSTVKIGANVVVSGNQTWGHSSGWTDGNTIVIDGNLTGSGNITGVSGSNTTTINGDASQYSGLLTVGQYGILNLKGGMTGGNITLTNAARMFVSGLAPETVTTWNHALTMQSIDGTPGFTLEGGKLKMSGSNSLRGSIVVNNNAELTFSGSNTFAGATTLSGSGTIFITGTSTLSGSDSKITIAQGVTLDVTSGSLKAGGYLNSTNMITVQGVLRVSNYDYSGSLGNIADYAANRLLDGGTLEITGGSQTIGQGTTISSKGGSFLYNNTGVSSAFTAKGNVNGSMFILNGDLNLGGSGTINLTPESGARALLSGSGNVTKVGSGTVNFNYTSNPSDWSGKMAVDEGVLTVSGNLGRRDVSVKSGATLNSGANASMTAKAGSERASMSGVAVSATSLVGTSPSVRGSVANMSMNVKNAYGLQNLTLSNSVFSIQQSVTLSLNDVIITGRTTSFAGTEGSGIVNCSNTALVLTGGQAGDTLSGNIRTVNMGAVFSNVQLTGTLNLDLRGYLYNPSDSYQYLAIRLFDNTTTFAESFDVNLINSYKSWEIATGSIEGVDDANWRTNGGLVYVLVPEPATATLSLLGLAGVMLRRRRRAA